MKKILVLVAAALTVGTASAQTPVQQGNFIIDAYVGFPQSNMIRSEPESDGVYTYSNYKLNGGLLSYGGRMEYMLADNFGIGIDGNYVVSGANYDYSYTDSVSTTTYNWDYTAKKTRIMARLNFHFVQNERVDAYAGFGAGWRGVKRTWTVEGPQSTEDLDQDKALIPFAVRAAIGARIYFTDNIGLNIELGAGGGGPLQMGLSVKI